VTVSAGIEGDTQKDLVLTEARAMVVRKYLVENYGFDDKQLKTLGMGKQVKAGLMSAGNDNLGSIQITIFPIGVELPAKRLVPEGITTLADPSKSDSDTTMAVGKP
jgi:hypothetical protein